MYTSSPGSTPGCSEIHLEDHQSQRATDETQMEETRDTQFHSQHFTIYDTRVLFHFKREGAEILSVNINGKNLNQILHEQNRNRNQTVTRISFIVESNIRLIKIHGYSSEFIGTRM